MSLSGIREQSFTNDYHGNLWMGDEGGLQLMSGASWVQRWGPNVFPAGAESVTRIAGFGLLVSSRNGVYRFNPAVQDWDELPGLFQAAAHWGTIRASNGDVWILNHNLGVVRLNRAGKVTATAFAGKATGIDFRVLLRDRTGTLWIGAKKGLYRLDERAPRLTPVPLPGGSNAVAFAVGPDGQEWLGYEGGIARLEEGEWKIVAPADRLLSPRIRSLAVSAGPVFWVSYRMRAPFSRVAQQGGEWKRQDFDAESGYGPNESRAMLVDRRGWVWRGSTAGLFVSDGTHFAPEDWVRLDRVQNMPSGAVGPWGLFEDVDGSIWVCTDEGVAKIVPDPEWWAPRGVRGRPRVTSVRFNGRENLWPSMNAQYAKLAAGQYRLEMRVGASGRIAVYQFSVVPGLMAWWWIPAGSFSGAAGVWYWRRYRVKTEYWKAKRAFLARARAHDEPPRRTGLIAGRYSLRKQIGEGGFAAVYRALDMEAGLEVAVKVLHGAGELEEHQRTRFEKEMEALRRIEHPGVVRRGGAPPGCGHAARRRAIPRHEVRRGTHAARDPGIGSDRPDSRRAVAATVGVGARRGAFPWCAASRPQAGKHHHRAPGPAR
jgi:streptogramin lyase